jgi:formylmethanofuran dehydrogenase subunit D
MKRSTWAMGLATLCGAALLTGCAASNESGTSQDLVGTWLGESTAATAKWGYEKGQRTLVIKDQQGNEFRGECTWTFKSDKAIKTGDDVRTSYDAATSTVRMTKTVVGTFNPATGKVVIAEQDGTGTITGKLVDANTLEIVFADSGAWARVFSAKLTRQGAAARK